MRRVLLAGLLMLVSAPSLVAHELQTASLRLEMLDESVVQATLKTPLARDGGAVTLVPQLEPDCLPLGDSRAAREGDAILRQWRMQCDGGLAGRQLHVRGLDPRMPDVLVSVRYTGDASQVGTVDRHDPVLRLRPVETGTTPAQLWHYLPIGIEHILLGPDHLLFVLGLMLVVFAGTGGLRSLVLALTAFTLAHSLTLALAVLGLWSLPSKPVELLIALSILLLAVEIVRAGHSRASGNPEAGFPLPRERQQSLTFRMPWLVAFVFGLLHGFGFAGALAEVGLPQAARGWALLLFNLGVEIGQLLFVAAILLVQTLWMVLIRRTGGLRFVQGGQGALILLLGGVATYWTLDRLLSWSISLGTGT